MPYYVVTHDRMCGIFNTWEECEAQVKYYPNAKHKRYNTLVDAEEAWLKAVDKMTEVASTSQLHTQRPTPVLTLAPTQPSRSHTNKAWQYILRFILGYLFTKVLNYL